MSEVEEDIEVDEDEGPQGPFSLDQLSERAKDNALYDYLSNAWDWECPLKEGYGDDAYFKEVFAQRGIDVSEWDWSIGHPGGGDYVAIKGSVDLQQWLNWRVDQWEALQWAPWPRPYRKTWNGVWVLTPRPELPAWVHMVETLLQSGLYWNDSAGVSNTRYGCIEVDEEWASVGDSDADTTCGYGVLAGARAGDLHDNVDYAELHKLLKADIEEVCDEACGSIREDYDWQSSMECFEELCAANEWRFDEDGKLV